MMNSPANLPPRSAKKLKLDINLPKICIVENHNEIVKFLHQHIGRKQLKFSGNTMLHLDSHPDLLIPTNLQADQVFQKESLYEQISIENWLMPLVAAGHVSTVVWVKPPWSSQIKTGKYEIVIGQDKESKKLRCDSHLDYFVSELLYQKTSQLTNCQTLNLFVLEVQRLAHMIQKSGTKSSQGTITSPFFDEQSDTNSCNSTDQPAQCQNDSNISNKSDNVSDFCTRISDDLLAKCFNSSLVDSQNTKENDEQVFEEFAWEEELIKVLQEDYLLDIDLDFFSTMDPFREMFSAEQYNLLKEIYKFQPPLKDSQQALEKCIHQREEQITHLEKMFEHIAKSGKTAVEEESCGSALRHLVNILPADSDWLMVHSVGTGVDSSELPHHVSTDAEVQQLFSIFTTILQGLPLPHLVTVSRSSEDSYCPPGQVDELENNVLTLLKSVFPSLNTEDITKMH